MLSNVFQKISQKKDVLGFFDVCQTLDKLPKKEKDIILNKKIKKELNKTCSGLNYLADIFREITSKNIIIDTSANIIIAEKLLSDDNWKIILLTRDPRGILYSYKKADARYNNKEPLKRKVNVFIDFAKKASIFKNNSKVLFVKYENLCRDSFKELRRICDFLNIDFEESMINFKKDLGHMVMGNRMRFDNNEKIIEDLLWQKKLIKKEKELITESKKLVALYKKLGYELT